MQQTRIQRRDIADLLHRGYMEAKESAAIGGNSTAALSQVRESSLASILNSSHCSSDIHLHKTLRFLAYAESCSNTAAASSERDTYVAALSEVRKENEFLSCTAQALSISETVDVTEFLSSFLLLHEEQSQAVVTLRDFVSTETEILLRDKASRNIAPNVMLLQSLKGEQVTQADLYQKLRATVSRISSKSDTTTADVFRSMFSEANLEIWALVASRTQEDGCSEITAMWRSAVAVVTSDCNSSHGWFSMLMFFLYLEGIISILTNFVSGEKRSGSLERSDQRVVAEQNIAANNDSFVEISVSVPVSTENSSIYAQQQQEALSSEAGTITVRKLKGPVQGSPDLSSVLEHPDLGTLVDADVCTSANTLASLAKFVELNKASYPEGLPKSLL